MPSRRDVLKLAAASLLPVPTPSRAVPAAAPMAATVLPPRPVLPPGPLTVEQLNKFVELTLPHYQRAKWSDLSTGHPAIYDRLEARRIG